MLLLKKMIPVLDGDKLVSLIGDFDSCLDSKRFLLMVFASMIQTLLENDGDTFKSISK